VPRTFADEPLEKKELQTAAMQLQARLTLRARQAAERRLQTGTVRDLESAL